MTTKFDTLLVPLYQATSFEVGQRTGVLIIKTAELLEQLNTVLSDEHKYGITLKSIQNSTLAIGDAVDLHLNEPRVGLGLLADSFSDVLCYPRGTVTAPKFFLLDLHLAYSDLALEQVEKFANYKKVLRLLELLGESSAYFDKEVPELVFIKDGKVALPVNYDVSDLLSLDAISLEALLTRFEIDTNREQKLAMLAEAVMKQCSGLESKRRFQVLLSHLKETLKSFDDSYRLFIANFSYDKVRDELQSEKIEELTKIHKTFSDIQGQILGIPLATVLVATQMKPATTWDSTAWINATVLTGVWVFAILMFFVLRNQLHTLDAIDQEIKRKKKKVEETYITVSDLVSKIFPELEKRLCIQRWAFRAVDLVVVVGFIMAHVMFFAMTESAWKSVKSLFT